MSGYYYAIKYSTTAVSAQSMPSEALRNHTTDAVNKFKPLQLSEAETLNRLNPNPYINPHRSLAKKTLSSQQPETLNQNSRKMLDLRVSWVGCIRFGVWGLGGDGAIWVDDKTRAPFGFPNCGDRIRSSIIYG